MGGDKDILGKKFLAQAAKWIVSIVIFVFCCGAAYSKMGTNQDLTITNKKNIINLGVKIDSENKDIYKEIDRKSINNNALTYRITSAQQKMIEEIVKLNSDMQKQQAVNDAKSEARNARIEVHLQYQSKSMDELKSSMKELQKKK